MKKRGSNLNFARSLIVSGMLLIGSFAFGESSPPAGIFEPPIPLANQPADTPSVIIVPEPMNSNPPLAETPILPPSMRLQDCASQMFDTSGNCITEVVPPSFESSTQAGSSDPSEYTGEGSFDSQLRSFIEILSRQTNRAPANDDEESDQRGGEVLPPSQAQIQRGLRGDPRAMEAFVAGLLNGSDKADQALEAEAAESEK